MLTPSLACQQDVFINLLLDDTQPLPAGWKEERFAVYRNAYRTRLVDAIRETYPRTERWVGEEAFRRAAIHHVIQHPPQSWTLDAVGRGMPHTLAELFAKDPEVSELAWLEWAMHECFVSADDRPMDAVDFQAATAAFAEDDWAAMELTFLSGTRVTPVRYRVDTLWRALAEGNDTPATLTREYRTAETQACVVWRQGMVPVAAPVSAPEGRALAMMLDGASYGCACATLADELGAEAAIAEAGAMLGRWIHNGMLADARPITRG